MVSGHASRLIRKLEQFTRLSAEDKEALETAASGHVRQYRPREDVIREGDRPRQVNLILDGWACRYKMLEDGRRQIMAFLLPGDMCDARMFVLRQMDHSIGVLSTARVAEISKERMLGLIEAHPGISRALWWDCLVEEAIQREWTTNLGQRDAFERLSHLLCELFIRLQAVGLTQGHSCELPVTQEELGDTTGMSTVHVNRTLAELRDAGLIVLKGKQLTIPDLDALRTAAMFNPNYLHLDGDAREPHARDA